MLVTGTIISVSHEKNARVAKINAHGTVISVSLALLPDAAVGMRILSEGGVAIAIIKQEERKEEQHVSCDSR